MSAYKIGDMDEEDNVLRKQRGPVQLWKTPKGNYLVYLWVTYWDDALHTLRKCPEAAEAIFDSVCNMFPNLPPEES